MMPSSALWTDHDRTASIDALRGAAGLRILVVGDLMVDQYLLGRVNRISPEAPVPVLQATKRERRPGGAANVALNLRAMGASVTLAGVVGNDEHGTHLRALLEEAHMNCSPLHVAAQRPTTVKTRVMSSGQHLLRVDEEVDVDLGPDDAAALVEAIRSSLDSETHDAILLEDYDKGALSPAVIQGILKEAKERDIPVSVDPKFRHFDLYKGVDLFKPNLKELKEGLGLQWEMGDVDAMESSIQEGLSQLDLLLQPKAVLLTLSERGVHIRHQGQDHRHPAHPRKILDVSGAGDTVIAVASVLMASGVSPSAMAAVANLAGGLVCETPGVVPIDVNRLIEEVQRLPTTP